MAIDARAIWELVRSLRTTQKSTRGTVAGTVTSVGSDRVWVRLDGGDGDTPTESPSADAKVGDRVVVSVEDGTARIEGSVSSPSVGIREVKETTNNVSERVDDLGGSLTEAVDQMGQMADAVREAGEIAQATGQHHWDRSEDVLGDGAGTGAFVTEEPRDDFLQAAEDGWPDFGYGENDKQYNNILINSLGLLLRASVRNLLSVSKTALAFYDGLGNTASNIRALFGPDGVRIGSQNGGNIIVNPDGIEMRSGSATVAKVGKENGGSVIAVGPTMTTSYTIDKTIRMWDTVNESMVFEYVMNEGTYMNNERMINNVWEVTPKSSTITGYLDSNGTYWYDRIGNKIGSCVTSADQETGVGTFILYDRTGVPLLRVLSLRLSNNERVGISEKSYVIYSPHGAFPPYPGGVEQRHYYEFAIFDMRGEEVSDQYTDCFFQTTVTTGGNYRIDEEAHGIAIYDGGVNGTTILYNRISSVPTFSYAAFPTDSGGNKDEYQLPVLPCIVLDESDYSLYYCWDDRVSGS